MKLKYDFDILSLGDEIIAVPIGNATQNFHGVVKMNNSANFIFQMLKDNQTQESILEALKENYDTPVPQLKEYAIDFIEELKKQNLLAE